MVKCLFDERYEKEVYVMRDMKDVYVMGDMRKRFM
jgi:hypothetical protein